MEKRRKIDPINIGKDVVQLELSDTAGGNTVTLANSMALP